MMPRRTNKRPQPSATKYRISKTPEQSIHGKPVNTTDLLEASNKPTETLSNLSNLTSQLSTVPVIVSMLNPLTYFMDFIVAAGAKNLKAVGSFPRFHNYRNPGKN